MIILWLLQVVADVLKAVFGILPSVPATPDSIVSGGEWVTNTIASVISVLQYVYTAPLLTAIILVIVGILAFESIYHLVMWVVRKIPFLNIH